MTSSNRPKILICLATHNGITFLNDQLDSILNQQNIDVKIYVSDDNSTDGTYEYLQKIIDFENRILLFEQIQKFGNAGKNFYRLILESDIRGYDYIAFADQDDIWENDKLVRHIDLLQKHGAEAVSSNVMAFWANGETRLLNKSKPQRQLDYLFESAGPGCTFLMTPWLVHKLKLVLTNPDTAKIAHTVALHDWLTYAVCRASGRTWYIDEKPSVQYRQHSNNVVGANTGIKAKYSRFKKISNGWYKAEVSKIVQICIALSDDPKYKKIAQSLNNRSFFSQIKLLSIVNQARRSVFDRFLLAFSILFKVF